MDIGKRLRELLSAKGMPQGEVERHPRLIRSHISRVEGEFTLPSLETLEKLAEAFEVEPYQLFYRGDRSPIAVKMQKPKPLSSAASHLIEMFSGMSGQDRRLLLSLAAKLAKS